MIQMQFSKICKKSSAQMQTTKAKATKAKIVNPQATKAKTAKSQPT
jgi:hypothetical protein